MVGFGLILLIAVVMVIIAIFAQWVRSEKKKKDQLPKRVIGKGIYIFKTILFSVVFTVYISFLYYIYRC